MVVHPTFAPGDTVYTVTYDSTNEFGVLFQRWGSIWPKTLPYCLLNLLIAIVLQWLYDKKGIDLSISGTSHGFMSTMIGFLLVTRVSMAYQRYLDLRGCLENMTRQTRELVQNMIILTQKFQKDADRSWRVETANRTLLLLRSIMAIVDYGDDRIPAWDIAELPQAEADEIKAALFTHSGKQPHDWSRSKRTEMEESMRVPMILAYKLRCCIDSGEGRLTGTPDAYRFFNLFGAVDSIMESYYLLRKQMTTPFPFPMEQMNRTFLYFYIFTVPLTLLEDVKDHYPYMQLVVTVFLTYGFVGLQRIAEELDDPFGNDQNDFNNIAMAQDTFDDVYLMIHGCDGPEAAAMLRSEILPAKRLRNRPLRPDETTPLVSG